MDRRKELKSLYKQTTFPIGVFQIKNTRNNKVLIGTSKNLTTVFNRHQFQLKMNCHKNTVLQQEWNQYGPDAYSFDILETLKTDELPPEKLPEALTALEEKWLAELSPYNDHGYNRPSTAKKQ
ncbi:MAG: Excinuclease subunit domain protein [Firmicutes bacterium]|nr:Excinuclease subunit domain protein [Bacillota bacterium]